MASRIENLEATITSLKRKHGEDVDEEDEAIGEPLEARPYVKQKIIIDDCVLCKGCNIMLGIDSFDMTSTRKKDAKNNIKVYQYRRSLCKDCNKAKRRPYVKRKKGQINTF